MNNEKLSICKQSLRKIDTNLRKIIHEHIDDLSPQVVDMINDQIRDIEHTLYAIKDHDWKVYE